MIDVKNLTKFYGQVRAVDDISFSVEKGSIVGFLGPNGAGKSTTLKVITCYHPADSGKVTVAGHDVLAESLEARRKIGYMPEAVPLYPELRVREYLTYRAGLRDIPRKQRRAAVDRVCETCWLSTPEDMTRRRLGELSRGYKQRVGLADVLLHDPPVLVLDEPTIGLDPAQIRQMRELVRGLAGEHTVILSSHILAEVEQTCDELVIISAGKLVAQGTPEQLRTRVVGASRVIADVSGGQTGQIVSAVKALDGVKHVDASAAGGWTRLEIVAKEASDPREAVYKLAASKNWTLRELRRRAGSLEDFFVQITYQQSVAAADARRGKE